MCKAQGLRHVSQATYKTNKLINDIQASSIKKNWSHWSFVGQPENMSSKVSNRTTRASLGSKGNEKDQNSKGQVSKIMFKQSRNTTNWVHIHINHYHHFMNHLGQSMANRSS